jgi:hypothetical protein
MFSKNWLLDIQSLCPSVNIVNIYRVSVTNYKGIILSWN